MSMILRYWDIPGAGEGSAQRVGMGEPLSSCRGSCRAYWKLYLSKALWNSLCGPCDCRVSRHETWVAAHMEEIRTDSGSLLSDLLFWAILPRCVMCHAIRLLLEYMDTSYNKKTYSTGDDNACACSDLCPAMLTDT